MDPAIRSTPRWFICEPRQVRLEPRQELPECGLEGIHMSMPTPGVPPLLFTFCSPT